MIKFISKTAFFIVPFFLLYIIKFLFLSENTGDLLRIGLLPGIDKEYRQKIISSGNKMMFDELSTSKDKTYKILTIGDSFSEQGKDGYQNFLVNDFSVLHINRFISNFNQIQKLIELCQGDFFDTYKIQYVVLEGVERHLIDNIKNINNKGKIDIKQIDSLIINHTTPKDKEEDNFFSSTIFKFPYSALKYYTDKNYISNKQVFVFELNTRLLFSNNSNELLFYNLDFDKTKQNNVAENATKLNDILNNLSDKLKEKNIKLIFLPCPDKYSLYYDYILDKKSLLKPVFFDNFKKLNKKYLYIDSKEVLSEQLNTKKDLYYFDDSHWSPVASELVAKKIKEAIMLEKQSEIVQQDITEKVVERL
ncbi:hypothetical protein AAGV28_01025 [Flavobacterium sp. FZUC8N2.13]|uniref:AlgX/AlgJ SGNH hydrolase-like domain-containing protein n=1 Tax=Flavobacterium zubiriense TaxID=3138075 RepID=A0ABV4T7E0_9FLAO